MITTKPVLCRACGTQFSAHELTKEDCNVLHDQHYYQEFTEELRMLQKVEDYFLRYPHALERFQSTSRLFSPEPLLLPAEGKEEEEVVTYLQGSHFSLAPRLRFVSEEVNRYETSLRAISCPNCKEGRLYVPSESWHDFTINPENSITWYKPRRHGYDHDGTLHLKSSGWSGDMHWTGKHTIHPEEPDYPFWCWLVAQKEYHHLVDEKELPELKEVWVAHNKVDRS